MHNRRTLALVVGALTFSVAACSSEPKAGSNVANNSSKGTPGAAGSPSPGAGGSTPLFLGGGGLNITVPLDIGGSPASTVPPPPPTDVTVIITADNAYGFGYGTDAQIVNYFGGVENLVAADIFDCGTGPETYTVPAAQANTGAYLYIIGYADKQTTQGVLAQFSREGADPTFTGTGPWQACATGVDYDPGTGGPTLDVINQQIAACNAGNTDPALTSAGWVSRAASARGSVAVGEDNSTDRNRPAPGNEFKIACGIDPTAHWLWYEWETARTMDSPFIYPAGDVANSMKDFMIFRLTADAVPEPIPK